jgi:hypothetical protein
MFCDRCGTPPNAAAQFCTKWGKAMGGRSSAGRRLGRPEGAAAGADRRVQWILGTLATLRPINGSLRLVEVCGMVSCLCVVWWGVPKVKWQMGLVPFWDSPRCTVPTKCGPKRALRDRYDRRYFRTGPGRIERSAARELQKLCAGRDSGFPDGKAFAG